MATLYGLREKLADTRQFLISQKGGLSRWADEIGTDEEQVWYRYAMDNTDKVRERLNEMIAYLDELIGER